MLFYVGGSLHVHDIAFTPANFVVYNISYSDELYMCDDDPSRRSSLRYGWFSNGQTNSDCSWVQINKARKKMGTSIVNGMIFNSLQLTAEKVTRNIDSVWIEFEKVFITLSDIINYVPAFEQYMYQGFEEFRKDNVQYIEVFAVFKSTKILH